MKAVVADAAVEILSVVAAAAGAVVFTLLGMVAELSGVQNLQAGEFTTGLWLAYMGAIALYVGVYLLGVRTALPAATRLRHRVAERLA